MTIHFKMIPTRRRLQRSVCILFITLVIAFAFHASESQAQNVSQEVVHQSVELLATAIDENYFDVELASRIQQDLLERLGKGEYAEIRTQEGLAEKLTARLEEMTQDKHLVVSPRPPITKTGEDTPPPIVEKEKEAAERAARRERIGKRSNFGVQGFQLLPGNIAYLNFTSFYRENEIREILAAQMKLAANADAIILDMRFNMGGSTGAVSLLSSYFFEGPERLLFEVVDRSGEARIYSTDPTVQNRNENRPVFVLVHPTTFSAGEGLAFVLQDQKRATIIGETTAGAANPGRPHYVNDWFEINIPNGQIKVANSGKNWEGTGVTPDIDSEGGDALQIAQRVALKKLIQDTTDKTYRKELSSILNELD